jgi:hypothetical protein
MENLDLQRTCQKAVNTTLTCGIIVKKDDEQEFGRYLTRDLILAYMRALKAGDTEAVVKLK